MKLDVGGKEVFAYTANHELDPAKRTVVFVHGAGLDHSWFGLQSRYFGYHGWNVLAVDLPGHGRSAGPPLATVPAMADWLTAVLDAAKIQKASLVGHSLGTLVALDCAARAVLCAAMEPPPPPEFSTTNDWSSARDSWSATVRPMRSSPPPGCAGTRIFTAFAG